jgi:hypothetical protein
LRTAKTITAQTIRIESTTLPAPTSIQQRAKPTQAATVAYAAAGGYITGDLRWDGVWKKNNFWCDSGFSPSKLGYYDHSSDDSFWIDCSAPTPTPAPTDILTANPTTIITGGSSTLSWTSTDATSCTSSDFPTGNATSGSVSVSPASTKTYTVSCTGPGGGPVNSSATVTVTASAQSPKGNHESATCTTSSGWAADLDTQAQPVLVYFYQDGTNITGTFAGATVTSGSRPDVCTFLGIGGACLYGYTYSIPGAYQTPGPHTLNAYARDTQGTAPDTFIGTQSYNCSGGSVPALSASPSTISAGAPTTLTYSCPATKFANIWRNGALWNDVSSGSAPDNGSIVDYPPVSSSYTLNCFDFGGIDNAYTSVTVNACSALNGTTCYSSANSCGVKGSGTYDCSAVCSAVVPALSPTVNITAVPARVASGGTTTLTITGSDLQSSCAVSGPGVNQNFAPAACLANKTIVTPPITSQSIYTVTCGPATAKVIVNVNPKFVPF